MKIEMGTSYRVVKNRESKFGWCKDIIGIEGKIVTVIRNAYSPESYKIKDEFGKTYVCQPCNLEAIKGLKKVLRDRDTEYGTVGEESPFKDVDGTKLYVGDVVEKNKNGMSGGKGFIVKTDDYGFFVMGIQCRCKPITGEIEAWEVKLVKEYESLKTGDKYGSITVIEVEEEIASTDSKPSEQLKDNIKEDGIVVKDLKIGDKVKVANKSKILDIVGNVDVGDTAIIENIEKANSYKIRMDKDNNYWYAKAEELELIADNPKFEIITTGTTTTVKIEDGRQGVAKLYYKDTYSKGFGIVAALGKAMDIDLVGEVQKVVGSYGLTSKKISSAKDIVNKTEVVRAAENFKVGDIIKGIDDKYYVTNKKMTKGEVVKYLPGGSIKVKVLEHKEIDWVGEEYIVEPEYFELVEASSVKFEVGCKVKIPTTKQGEIGRTSAVMNIAKRRDQDHLFLVRIDKEYCSGKDIYVLSEDIDGIGDFFHLEDLELYTEAPSLKKPILKEGKACILTIADFKIGDKVVPHAKTARGYEGHFEKESNWKEAKKLGQPYLYVTTKYRTPVGEQVLKLNSSKNGYSGNYYLPTDVTLYNKEKKEVVKAEEPLILKVGDSIKIRTDLVPGNSYDGGCYFDEEMNGFAGKEAKIVALRRGNPNRFEIDVDNDEWSWSPSMLEKVKEKAEDEVTVTVAEVEFKKGDYIYYKETSSGKFGICKINKIKDQELWGCWTTNYVEELPKTIKEFESLKVNSRETYVNARKGNAYKKLVLVDDSEPEFKIGDEVTRDEAIKILEDGGEIKDYEGWIYFIEDSILKYKILTGEIKKSSGYGGGSNLHGTLKIESFSKLEPSIIKEDVIPAQFVTVQAIDNFQAKKMVKEGKEIIVNNIFKYFLEDDVLMFRSIKTGMLHESLGFKEAFKEGFVYSAL
ncbi:hypothetical protein G9F71_008705 [Clostridium sp. FP2]|uniref:hypothetical protein n=1 Tax=Clostridium sp. FP2 TaxID=2724481 RepID=UPI0013E92B0F|nr:hypothetical protein [Clostridium sp. FP2]MBZ9622933.1 hypothetical protein [Clostridium sp. FP2]